MSARLKIESAMLVISHYFIDEQERLCENGFYMNAR